MINAEDINHIVTCIHEDKEPNGAVVARVLTGVLFGFDSIINSLERIAVTLEKRMP